ncbi:hypothetical protein [Tumidithrix helvetica]
MTFTNSRMNSQYSRICRGRSRYFCQCAIAFLKLKKRRSQLS